MLLVVCFPLVIWNMYLFSCCIKRNRNIWHMIHYLCVSSSCYWNTILSIDRSFCVWLLSEGKPCGSHQQQISHLDHWEHCAGRSVLGVLFEMNTDNYFNACSASFQCPHTCAFILHAHQAHQFCSKPLQTHFWSLCWGDSKGCGWQWKGVTSMPPKDSTVWGPSQV